MCEAANGRWVGGLASSEGRAIVIFTLPWLVVVVVIAVFIAVFIAVVVIVVVIVAVIVAVVIVAGVIGTAYRRRSVAIVVTAYRRWRLRAVGRNRRLTDRKMPCAPARLESTQ